MPPHAHFLPHMASWSLTFSLGLILYSAVIVCSLIQCSHQIIRSARAGHTKMKEKWKWKEDGQPKREKRMTVSQQPWTLLSWLLVSAASGGRLHGPPWVSEPDSRWFLYLRAVLFLQPLALLLFLAGEWHYRHYGAVVVLLGRCPGHQGGGWT